MGPKQGRWQHQLRHHGVPEALEQHHGPLNSARHLDCRRIHKLPLHHTSARTGRPWLPLQVEHGLDERLLELHRTRTHTPQVPPQPTHVQHGVRLFRKFHTSFQPRRSGTRQGQHARQDARRQLAEVCKPPPHLRLPVCAPGQKTQLHGQRIRAVPRMERKAVPRLAPD